MTDVCDGCISYDFCFITKKYKKYGDCPCGNCLVKVICINPCNERVTYVEKKREEKENE